MIELEAEQRKDDVHKAGLEIGEIGNQIADALARKDLASRENDRAGYDRAIADLGWLEDQRKICIETYERKCRRLRKPPAADLTTLTRRLAHAAREAAEFAVALERLHGVAHALAREQRSRARRCRRKCTGCRSAY